MADLRPEDLDISTLPRTRLGHLQEDAVADMLQRAAWSYREALAEGQQLARTVEELTARFEDLSAQVASLEESRIRRKEPDELALSLLAAAQRSAREARESARREAELILKKATRRAGRLEKDAARGTEKSRAEVARLEKVRETVAEQLRQRLETIAALYGAEAESGSTPEENTVRIGSQP
jgi:cell division initiation protein